MPFEPFIDPDQPVIALLRHHGASMISGQLGGLVSCIDYLPVGSERDELLAELEETGLRKIIVDTSTGDSLVVGDVDADEARRAIAQTMRRSPRKPVVWPPIERGAFPLVASWAYPYGSDDGTGRSLFLSGRGSRPIRVFLAADLFDDPGADGVDALLAQLRDPQIEAVVVDADVEGLPDAIRVTFEPDTDQQFEGVVRDGASGHHVVATDAVGAWRLYGPQYYRALEEAEAADRAERDALGAHIAVGAEADLIVTLSPLLLSRPDGIAGHTPQVIPNDAFALIGLYLRQRDSYVVRPPATPNVEVRADRSHFFRAAARGYIPSLHRWRSMLDAQPDVEGGNLGLLGESFEHRVSRMLGQRDELLASLLVRQDANTSYRAMEHLDAFLSNLTSALDVTCRVADRLATDGVGGTPMNASWTRRSGKRLRRDHPELDQVLDEQAIKLISVVSELRNTLHSEMLLPEPESGQMRSGITLVAFRPRDVAEFESNVAVLGELDEWGCEVDGPDVRIDSRRFIAKALPAMLGVLDGLLRWMLDTFGGDADAPPHPVFGSWYPAAACRELALGSRWVPPADIAPVAGASRVLFYTAVLGVVERDGRPTGRETRVVLNGTFKGIARPHRDFNVGDRLTAFDPLIDWQRMMRVEAIAVQGMADGSAAFTVSLSAWGPPPGQGAGEAGPR